MVNTGEVVDVLSTATPPDTVILQPKALVEPFTVPASAWNVPAPVNNVTPF